MVALGYAQESALQKFNNIVSIQTILSGFIGACWLFIVYSGLVISEPANTQQVTYNQRHIFSDDTVHAITQDHHGFIWFGTQQGLHRFDGYSFKTFVHDDYDPGSIQKGRIVSILEDSNDQFWIGTANNGLSLFDPSTQTFSHFKQNKDDQNSLSNNNIKVIFEDNSFQLWVGTENGLNRYLPQQQGFVRYLHHDLDQNTLSHNAISDIVEDKDGGLWIATDGGGLNRFDLHTEIFEHYRYAPGQSNSLISDGLSALQFDSQGHLWIGSRDQGLSRFNLANGEFTSFSHATEDRFSLSDNSVNAIYQDGTAQIWIATDQGLNKWLPNSARFEVVRRKLSGSEISSRPKVYSIIKDNNELLWIGTSSGLYKWNTNGGYFERVRHSSKDHHLLNGYSVASSRINYIGENPQGDLLTGGKDGFNIFDAETSEKKLYPFESKEAALFSRHAISSFYLDKNNVLWLATKNFGFASYDSKTKEFKKYQYQPNNSNGVSSNAISLLKPARNNKIWIGTWGGGLNLFDPDQQSFQRFQFSSNPNDYVNDELINNNNFNNNKITSLFEANNGYVWIGTFGGGINLLDLSSGKVTAIKHQIDSPDSLSSNNIWVIHQDRQGRLWIGSHAGLSQLTSRDDELGLYQFKNYTLSDGLASKSIVAILEDELGNLWLSGNAGLAKFDPASSLMTNYTFKDSLYGSEFYPGANFKNIDGKLFFGGVNGVTTFYPNELKNNEQPPQVKLTQILINNIPLVLAKPLQEVESVELDYSDYLLDLEYASLDYSQAQKNRYRYKLEGYDHDWIEAGGDRSASYTKLPAGNYIFKVKASNSEGIWNHQAIEIAIKMRPAPWLTWWAISTYVIMLLLGIYFTIVTRTKRYRQQAEKLNQLVTERTQLIETLLESKNKLFSNISHEFRTPLTLISGPVQSILDRETLSQSGTEQLSLIKKNTGRLLHLVEQLLDIARFDVLRVEDKKIQPLDIILKQVLLTFNELVEKQGIAFKVGRIEPVSALLVQDAFEKIGYNLFSNATKYSTSGGEIFVELTATNDHRIKFVVKDNGKGIAEDQQLMIFERFARVQDAQSETVTGAGIGLALVKDLVEAHGGSLSLVSRLGEGSCFTIYFPCCNKQLQPISECIEQEFDTLQSLEPVSSESHLLSQESTVNENALTTILVVEDNLDMQTYLKQILQESYHCLFANDGKQGLAIALETVPDLIISDVMMPQMDGFELSQRIKSEMVTSHIPLLLLTARGDKESRLTGWRGNADEYITKPFDPEELLIRISNLLNIRSVLRKKNHDNYLSPKNNSDNGKHKSLLIKQTTDVEGMSASEKYFIEQLKLKTSKLYQDPQIKIATIANSMAMSDRQLNRKIKSILDVTPGEYLKTFRLQEAALLILTGMDIASAGYASGFSSHSYFSQCFKIYYGQSPSEYLEAASR